jgi:hypothetical protein
MRRARSSRRASVLAVAAAAAVAGAVVAARVEFDAAPVAPRAVAVRETATAARPARVAPGAVPAAAPVAPVADAKPIPPAPGRHILFTGEKPRPGTLAKIARDLIAEHRDDLGLAAMPGDLEPTREFESLAGWHLRYRQTLHGVPVFGSEVSAHVAKDGRPLLVAACVFPVEGVETTPAVSPAESAAAVAGLLTEDGASVESKTPELVILPAGRGGRLAWRVDARTADESARVFVDAKDGRALRVDDLRRTDDGSANVFVPNPVDSQRDPTLRDNFNADSAALTAARVPVILRRLDGTGFLRGPWVDVTRTRKPAQSVTLDWRSVTRSDPIFEQLMAYYHIDTAQQRLQDLGMKNVNARPTPADAHAFRDDNSYYDPFDQALHFGDGGVDDAEDGDVIHHEYGHAMQDDQVTDFGLTDEGGAMGEGFGDFHAVSFHTHGDALYDPAFAAWDGTAFSTDVPPALRRVDGTKRYPADVVGEVHSDGEIWSRFLWDLRGLVGNDESLRTVVESHFLVSASARFKDGADAILAVDESLHQGAHVAAIKTLLDARGLQYTGSIGITPLDDAFEPNDDAAHAAPIGLGFHSGLVLADDDWYTVNVPPNRRLRVTAKFAAGRAGLIAEIRTPGGGLVGRASGFDGTAGVDAPAGPDGATFLIHLMDIGPTAPPAAYDLGIVETDLLALRPGRTRLVHLEGDGRAAYRVDVSGAQVHRGAKLRIVTRDQHGTGALTDVRVTSPSGRLVSPFGDARTAAGTNVLFPADEAGPWIVELAPREGTGGAFTVKVRFQ